MRKRDCIKELAKKPKLKAKELLKNVIASHGVTATDSDKSSNNLDCSISSKNISDLLHRRSLLSAIGIISVNSAETKIVGAHCPNQVPHDVCTKLLADLAIKNFSEEQMVRYVFSS